MVPPSLSTTLWWPPFLSLYWIISLPIWTVENSYWCDYMQPTFKILLASPFCQSSVLRLSLLVLTQLSQCYAWCQVTSLLWVLVSSIKSILYLWLLEALSHLRYLLIKLFLDRGKENWCKKCEILGPRYFFCTSSIAPVFGEYLAILIILGWYRLK